MKKALLILLLLTITCVLTYRHSYSLTHFIIKYYYYQHPNYTKNFYVHVNTSVGLPNFLQTVIKKAFYDKNVVFDNSIPLIHLAVHDYLDQDKTTLTKPSITFSGENSQKKPKKFTPFLEFLSNTPIHDKQLYFPLIAWSGIEPKKDFTDTNRKKFLVYISSNCEKNREELFKLIKKKRGDAEALGPCSNTTPHQITPRSHGSWQSLPPIYSQYNFAFALENSQAPGYITEKIITAFNSGAIPIYWGDSNTVKKWFNQKAYIDISDFHTLEEAASYIVKLSKDQKRIKTIQQEPIFKENTPPQILLLHHKYNTLIEEAATKLRKEYFIEITKNREKYYPNKMLKLFYKMQNSFNL